MTEDPTESARRVLALSLNAQTPVHPTAPTWTTEALTQEFQVHHFLSPFVIVTHKKSGRKGSLLFTHSPRLYFGWEPDPQS